jgi:hypothetical protein
MHQLAVYIAKHELERQLEAALFERVILNPPKSLTTVRQTHPDVLSLFKML